MNSQSPLVLPVLVNCIPKVRTHLTRRLFDNLKNYRSAGFFLLQNTAKNNEDINSPITWVSPAPRE